MCEEYEAILQEALSKKKQAKKFIAQLKKHKQPKKIQQLFNQFHSEVFDEIDCLKCANCCSSISPMITDNDIQRMAKGTGEKPSMIAEKYLEIDNDNDYVFRESPCPFLETGSNLCAIYENRPRACKQYPHTDQNNIMQLLNITFKNGFVCPAVYLIMKKIQSAGL